MEPEIPDYAKDPLLRCVKSLGSMLTMLKLTNYGFSFVANRPTMVQRIIDLTSQAGGEVTDDTKADLVKAKKDASFADNELKTDFPFMHASMVVAAWGSLEASVEDMLVGIALNEPPALERDEFMKIKIPLARFIALEKDERIRYLVTEAQRSLSTGAAQGVDTFENILFLFGLSGEVDDSLKKVLWEMNHVRNVIVHRDSHADFRLIQSCPSLGAKVGDRIFVNYDKYGVYHDAVFEYIKTLFRRLSFRYVVPLSDWLIVK